MLLERSEGRAGRGGTSERWPAHSYPAGRRVVVLTSRVQPEEGEGVSVRTRETQEEASNKGTDTDYTSA